MLLQDAENRRRLNRLHMEVPVECELFDSSANKTVKRILTSWDINSDGVSLRTDELIALGSEIKISFKLTKSSLVISAVIRIVRTEMIDKNLYVGAVFINLDEEYKQEISRLTERLDINKLLELTIKEQASDLHLVVNMPPVLRVYGELQPSNLLPLGQEDIRKMLYSIMNKQQIKNFEETKDLDFGVQYDLRNRFRVNIHQQRGFIEAAFRLINTQVDSFENLKIPDTVKDMARLREGLIIITGPTGAGKTTTAAAMIDLINKERKALIITLERPIEYVHTNNKCIVKQREVGVDTDSFAMGLKTSLRQDPNVLVVGELDDSETVRTALIAAEAGYLVIVTFHGPNTVQTIDRLVSMFPPENRRQFLSQLANCLKGIVCQLLIPCKDTEKRVLASEILFVNDAVRRHIRTDELYQIPTIIQTGGNQKMMTMYNAIKAYLDMGIIDIETADFYSQEFTRYRQI